MATIELLEIGCSGQELIDTVNALIAAHNSGEGAGVTSYNDLTDKPVINGETLTGSMTTAELKIAMSGTTDYDTLMDTLATKSYSDAGDQAMVAAAQAAAQAVLDSKLDKDLGNIAATTSVGDDAYIPIVNSDGTVGKITTSSMASYTEIRSATQRTVLSEAVKSQLKIIPLTGDQDGSNTSFTASVRYTLGTSCLYYNGQLLTSETDYIEENSSSIVMLTHIPTADDVLTFLAVPIS